ncbi:hypothetical protein PUNSTDRAFT_126233 [Punctularia strigosozonata HHB-11173 SS5]|uniref:uncharacterized protein n=1 Tax=Punctularia strigosozonata (strain HHB-11173) TaxID=741275 RepID=UPI000441797F|nr:uncharacterized protein PUNSTDRAFT_126233 [Punctularia strigosozonata HHB-11173 SS5]EIN09129.1 hypothetical protein PUNSTDRAFT_126233 [Punctularia strigosozonata HHB-11173 SS5]
MARSPPCFRSRRPLRPKANRSVTATGPSTQVPEMSSSAPAPRRSARLNRRAHPYPPEAATPGSVVPDGGRDPAHATTSRRFSPPTPNRRPGRPKPLAADFSTTSTLTTLSVLEAELAANRHRSTSQTPEFEATLSSSDDGEGAMSPSNPRTPPPRPLPSQSAILTPRKLAREARLPMSQSQEPVNFWHDDSQQSATDSQVQHLTTFLPVVEKSNEEEKITARRRIQASARLSQGAQLMRERGLRRTLENATGDVFTDSQRIYEHASGDIDQGDDNITEIVEEEGEELGRRLGPQGTLLDEGVDGVTRTNWYSSQRRNDGGY